MLIVANKINKYQYFWNKPSLFDKYTTEVLLEFEGFLDIGCTAVGIRSKTIEIRKKYFK